MELFLFKLTILPSFLLSFLPLFLPHLSLPSSFPSLLLSSIFLQKFKPLQCNKYKLLVVSTQLFFKLYVRMRFSKRASLDRAGNAKSWALGHSSVRWGPRSKTRRTGWERATHNGAREPRVFRFPEARWRKHFPKKGSTKSDAAEDSRRILRSNFWCSTQDPYKSSFDGGMGTKVGTSGRIGSRVEVRQQGQCSFQELYCETKSRNGMVAEKGNDIKKELWEFLWLITICIIVPQCIDHSRSWHVLCLYVFATANNVVIEIFNTYLPVECRLFSPPSSHLNIYTYVFLDSGVLLFYG